MTTTQTHPVVRFLVALVIVVIIAVAAFYGGYRLGLRLAIVPPPFLFLL